MNKKKIHSSWHNTPVEVLPNLLQKSQSWANLLQGIAEATKELLTHNDYSTGIQSALAILGRFTGVDRVYIFEMHPHPSTEEPAVSQRFAWVRESSGQLRSPNLQNFTYIVDKWNRWYQAFATGKTMSGLARNLPPAERAILEAQSILSILVVPIPIKDKLWGFIGFDSCQTERLWAKDEEAVLTTMAVSIGSTIAHQQTENALKQSYLQLQQVNTNLERQVQERSQELAQKTQELQEANQLKDLLLHAVTHDLRTPLIGWVMVLKNLLKSPEATIPVSRSILERMIHCSDRQLRLANSLLEVHSGETGSLVLHREPVQLRLLFCGVVADLAPLLAKNEVTLTNLVTRDLPVVSGDWQQLRRVLENLLTNALNHNPPGISLTLNATVESDTIRCTLQDNGAGMKEETCASLFEMYVRKTHTRRATGICLSLYLCRQIITAHGGEIGAVSCPDGGATFWFTLPLMGHLST